MLLFLKELISEIIYEKNIFILIHQLIILYLNIDIIIYTYFFKKIILSDNYVNAFSKINNQKYNKFWLLLCFLKNKIIIQFDKKINQNILNNYITFEDVISLKKIYIKNIKIINTNMFANCINLEHVFIGKETQIIKHNAFDNCINLKYVFCPKSIHKIENNAFLNCLKLEKVIFY